MSIAVDHIDTLKMYISAEDVFYEIWDNAKVLNDEKKIPKPHEKRRRKCRNDAINAKMWVKSDYKEKLFLQGSHFSYPNKATSVKLGQYSTEHRSNRNLRPFPQLDLAQNCTT